MNDEYETQKLCNITDDVTKIRYKVIYRRSADRYEIWTRFRDALGKLHRNRITFSEAIAVESDKDKTIAYVNDYLVANHINIYEDKLDKRKVGNRQSAKKTNVSQIIIPAQTFDNYDCKDLEQLFILWRKAQSEEPEHIWKLTKGPAVNISKDHFRRDGIIVEEIFRQEKTKILFISSEANDDDYSAKYNASPSTVDDYLSSKERRIILQYAIKEGIVTRNRAISYIKYFIRLNEHDINKREAIKKRESDIEWLLGEDYDTERIVGVRKIISE